MTAREDGTLASRAAATPLTVSDAHMTALRKQLDQVIRRQAANHERDRIAERAALVARLGAPRIKKKQKDVPFVPRKD